MKKSIQNLHILWYQICNRVIVKIDSILHSRTSFYFNKKFIFKHDQSWISRFLPLILDVLFDPFLRKRLVYLYFFIFAINLVNVEADNRINIIYCLSEFMENNFFCKIKIWNEKD